MFMSPPNSYVGIIMPEIMMLGVGTFGRFLDHEGGTLMNKISTFIKKVPHNLLAVFCHVMIQIELCILEEGHYQIILAL